MTKAFLRRICSPNQTNNLKSVPTYGLFDYDADGIGILCNYQHGSAKLAHEAVDLMCPIRWIGLKSTDIVGAVGNSMRDAALMSLSCRDRRRVILMLARKPFSEDGGQEPEWRRELQVMLMLNIKAEMQLLEGSEGLATWINRILP
jgi:meiotic recombination protein SPO11